MVLVAAVGVPASGCRGCDDVGCVDQVVTAALSAPVDRFPLTVEICVDGACVTRSPAPTTGPPAAQPELIEIPVAELGIDPLDPDEVVDVTVLMTDRDGVVVLDVIDTVRPTSARAGGHCGPRCTQLDLTY